VANIGRSPCDEGVVRTSRASAPCTPASGPWVLAATIIGSAMFFIDSTITNVALLQIQEPLGRPPLTPSGSSRLTHYLPSLGAADAIDCHGLGARRLRLGKGA
jgi:hypothetical protein